MAESTKFKRPYESPVIVDLSGGGFVSGKCQAGGSAERWKCKSGGSPAKKCQSGSVAYGGFCKAGSVAGEKCKQGNAPAR